MVRPAYFDKYGMKKGLWDEYEDYKLKACITRLGHVVPNWRLLPTAAGLKRCGKSCRLRWMNYLKPGLNKGKFSKLEEDLIIKLHKELGNKWSAIAANFPGRTDNDIKNYWNAHIKKRKGGVDREIRAQSLGKNNLRNDQDQQSSDDNSSFISLSAENMESNADSDNNGYAILDVDLPPLFPEEELNGFGLWQNDMVSDYSDAARFLEEDLLMIEGVGEECFSMGLW